MLMPKKDRVAIYEYLFKEGVLVARKDFHAPKHPHVPNVPNLHVIKALQSLKSRGYVTEQFAWRHFYWYLTNEGIQYLRDFLHLPPEIVPSTLKRQSRNEANKPRMKVPERDPRPTTSQEGYRRNPVGGPDKKGDVGAGANPSWDFKQGFGRGRGGGMQH